MPVIEVARETGVRFGASIRGHTLTFHQPAEAGGGDAGPTPTETFVASVAACVAYYVERFLERHDLDPAGLRVTAAFAMAQRPSRVGEIDLAVIVPSGVPDDLRAPLLAVAEHCTVHNSLTTAPAVRFVLESGPVAMEAASR
jgi:putative redox protein